jgi:hypothetical protein
MATSVVRDDHRVGTRPKPSRAAHRVGLCCETTPARQDLQEQVLEARTRTLGPEHPYAVYARDGLAYMLAELDEAS